MLDNDLQFAHSRTGCRARLCSTHMPSLIDEWSWSPVQAARLPPQLRPLNGDGALPATPLPPCVLAVPPDTAGRHCTDPFLNGVGPFLAALASGWPWEAALVLFKRACSPWAGCPSSPRGTHPCRPKGALAPPRAAPPWRWAPRLLRAAPPRLRRPPPAPPRSFPSVAAPSPSPRRPPGWPWSGVPPKAATSMRSSRSRRRRLPLYQSPSREDSPFASPRSLSHGASPLASARMAAAPDGCGGQHVLPPLPPEAAAASPPRSCLRTAADASPAPSTGAASQQRPRMLSQGRQGCCGRHWRLQLVCVAAAVVGAAAPPLSP